MHWAFICSNFLFGPPNLRDLPRPSLKVARQRSTDLAISPDTLRFYDPACVPDRGGGEYETPLQELQALRLLRAFSEIKDPQAREAITAYAEKARDTEHKGSDHEPDAPAPERPAVTNPHRHCPPVPCRPR